MPKHTLGRTAVTLCAAASLAAATGTASAQADPPPSAQAVAQQSAHVRIVDCFSQPQVRPSNFLLACGDGNSILVSLQWSQWDPTSAVARGVNQVNDCKPYCAAGTFHSYRVIVRLDHPQPWKNHVHKHYTRMRLIYTHGSPDGFQRTVTYTLWS
jgi:hypothetical protein